MRKLTLSILFLLIIAGVPTAAYAINAQIKVNGAVVAEFPEVATPLAGDALCSPAPCSVTRTTAIPDGNYGGVLNIIGGYAEATVQTNATTIGASTSITTITNISGTIRYIGPGVPLTGATIEIVTSNKFALPSGAWTTASKGGFKCKLASGVYNSAACSLTASTVQSGTCTLCRAFGYTDEGYVTRPDPNNPNSNLPANLVTVTMTSNAIFEDTAGVQRRTEAVGNSLSYTVPDFTQNVEDGHFYLGDNQKENIPCEPLKDSSNVAFTCGSNETKTATLTFTNVQPNDLILMPATSTTVSASDPAVLQIYLQADIPIDLQPNSDIVFDPDLYGGIGGYKGGNNSDFNVGSHGSRHLVALSTDKINTCTLKSFDATTGDPLVFLSVAGSDFVPPVASGSPFLGPDGVTCIGQSFDFDIDDVVFSIPGDTEDEKRATCLDNPSATLIIADVTQVSGYQVPGGKGNAPKKTFSVVPECTKDNKGNVTCSVTAPVGGSQIVNCCPHGPTCGT